MISHPNSPPPPESNRQPALCRNHGPVRFISLFYLTMAAAGLALIWWRRPSFSIDPLATPGPGWLIHLIATVAIILAVHSLSRILHTHLPSLRASARDMRRLLGELTWLQAAAVALASGVGEEILFRGWLLPETSLWLSSVAFGIVHFPPNRQWLYWPVFAGAMGFLLGWLQIWTGSIVFPILLHAGVNFLNLRLLLRPPVPR